MRNSIFDRIDDVKRAISGGEEIVKVNVTPGTEEETLIQSSLSSAGYKKIRSKPVHNSSSKPVPNVEEWRKN